MVKKNLQNISGINVTLLGPGLDDSTLVSASFLNNYNVSTISYFAPSQTMEDAGLSTFTRISVCSLQEATAISYLMRTLNWTLGNFISLFYFSVILNNLCCSYAHFYE